MNQEEKTTLAVKGMTCPSCTRHVDMALRSVEGVGQVEVIKREGKAIVFHRAGLESRVLVEALGEAGYQAAKAA